VRQLKNGQAVPVALTVSPILGADGAISGVSAIARDISERLRVQAELLSTNQQLRVALVELALSRTRLHDLFTQAPAIIATVRGPAHVFELVNPDFVQLVGRVGAAELVGQSVGEALPELVSQGFLEIVDRVYATGEPFVGTEVPLQFRSGDGDALEDHFLTFVVQPSRGATGAVDGLLLFATEVTGQVRTQQQMIQQERLRALGEMASGIVHDFNNVLTPVVGFSELLLKVPGTIDDPVKARQYVEMIFTSAKDAAAVVSRLGEFSRPRDEGEILEPVDLAPLVEQVIRLTQPRWRDQALASGQTVQVKMKRRLSPPVAGRAPELREILTNLLFNAVDAMPTGGTITVSVRPEPRGYTPSSGAIAGAGSRRAGVLLSVHDTGTGMSEETRRRCLEPFYTTKGHRGTGLGLAMVYGIVRRMSGDLTIESAPGRGTTITIRLPAYLASPAPEATAPPPTPPPLRVLVVDDEPVVQQVTMAYLVAEGHRPTAVGGGREALECLDAGGTDAFDVVITDGAMPGMNGDELALAIKERAPRLPVILLTGFGGLIGPSGVPGVDTVLSKPINLAALRQALDGLVGPPTEAR
jgi:signal transduction histidine kinase